jgi:P27 family predicted phage terminase small subunit
MGRPENSVGHIELTGNARHLTEAQIKERTARQAGNVIPLALVAGRPTCPRHLSKAARKEWLAMVKLLESRSVLDPGSGPTLELWATTKATWIEAKADLDRRGLQIEIQKVTSKGELYTTTIENPMLKIVDNCVATLQQLTKSLGIDPSAREKVKKVKGVARAGSNSNKPAWLLKLEAEENNDATRAD